MSNEPKQYIRSKTLDSPFHKDGSPTLVTSIVATLLNNEPLTKERILSKVGEEHAGRTRGYLSNHFSELAKLGIFKFTKRGGTWRQGINYKDYIGYVFTQILQQDQQAVDSLQYRLMPKKDEQSLDFITSPKEDIFKKPNPYLDD